SPTRATNHHVSVIGHISPDELLRFMTATELANGFLNRFALVAVRRTKLLPDGGDLRAIDWQGLRARLTTAVARARTVEEVSPTDAARQCWADVYPQLSAESSGLYGAVVARAEAHVVRYSLLYALLDGAAHIDLPHLQAALSLWAYADRSARWIFGDTLGDPVADDIWQAMAHAQEGLTREQIRDLFSRNKSAKIINSAISTLERAGRLCTTIRQPGKAGGRPTKVYVPVTGTVPYA
ncbi:MAG: DUF3987 domain-containing protein, partial [Chloroflexota bacterium]